MKSTTVLICVAAIVSIAECRTFVKREAALNSIDPNFQESSDENLNRDKRKVEVVTGVKNALLGLVFNKLNSFIDQKTAWINQLDKQNIAKNAQHNIVGPSDPVISITSVLTGAIGPKLQAAAPIITLVTNKLGSLSTGASGSSSGGSSGFNLGALISGGLGSSNIPSPDNDDEA